VWYINLCQALVRNPALWSLIISLAIAGIQFPPGVDATLKTIATPIVPLSLVMIGLQLSLLPALRRLSQAITCLLIKMLFTPLVVGTVLMFLGIEGKERQTMVLQMGMPPAFATLVIAQAYNLDRDLSVTTLGSVMLLFTLPIWLWLFA
jgi:predicted permease